MRKGTGKPYWQARALRRALTLPEASLWRELRKARGDLHWRKQHPAGAYALDFYCDRAKLCVQVDGEAHERADRPARDARRDAWLAERGVATLRIAAAAVLGGFDGVVQAVSDTARKRAPLHRPSDGLPLRAEFGED